MQIFRFSALFVMVLDLCCMQPHDLMYAFHIVSLHIHNNRHAQNFFFHIWDHIDPILFYSPESILIGITLIHKLHKSLISFPKLIFVCYCSSLCIVLAFLVNYMHLIL